jgi:hypothetical protein
MVELDVFATELKDMSDGKFIKGTPPHYLLSSLARDILFDDDPNGAHFRNGRFDFKSCSFVPLFSNSPFGRTPTMLVTRYLDYDWKELRLDAVLHFEKIMLQIYGTDDVAEYVLFKYAQALCGTSIKDCDLTVNLGMGGSG